MKKEIDIDKIIEQELQEESGVSVAVRQLTSDTIDNDDIKLSDIDFKTNLKLREILSQSALEWLNDVMIDKQSFKKELRIVRLIRRLKRLRVSEGAMGRKGVQDIFIAQNATQNPDKNFFQSLFTPRQK